MQDKHLESLLRAADNSAGSPHAASPDMVRHVQAVSTRRRERAVRAKFTGAFVGCYIAGLVTMWTVLAAARSGDADLARQPAAPGNSLESGADNRRAADGGQAAAQVRREPRVPSPRPELAFETSLYSLWRRMGDECQQRGDIETAVAYYGQALDAATQVERRISFELDNWLLISLKKDRSASPPAAVQGDSI